MAYKIRVAFEGVPANGSMSAARDFIQKHCFTDGAMAGGFEITGVGDVSCTATFTRDEEDDVDHACRRAGGTWAAKLKAQFLAELGDATFPDGVTYSNVDIFDVPSDDELNSLLGDTTGTGELTAEMLALRDERDALQKELAALRGLLTDNLLSLEKAGHRVIRCREGAGHEDVVQSFVLTIASYQADVESLTRTLKSHDARRLGEYWVWQDDGNDHLSSLTCRVLIEASQLRGLIKNACRLALVLDKLRVDDYDPLLDFLTKKGR